MRKTRRVTWSTAKCEVNVVEESPLGQKRTFEGNLVLQSQAKGLLGPRWLMDGKCLDEMLLRAFGIQHWFSGAGEDDKDIGTMRITFEFLPMEQQRK